MTYSYSLNIHAQHDYEQSLAWYSERSANAAENFVQAIDNVLQLSVIVLIAGETSIKIFMKSICGNIHLQ
jgi:hypothetical protein